MSLLWQDDRSYGSLADFAFYFYLAAAHLAQTSADVVHSDVRAAVVLNLVYVKALAVVGNDDLKAVFGFACGDGQRSAASFFADSVLYRVFGQRLDRKLRQHKVFGLDVVNYVELFAEAQLFYLQIFF